MKNKLFQYKSMRGDLSSGNPLYGWYVTYQLPDIVEMIAPYWDWLWIDMQHSPIDSPTALAIVRSAEATGIHSLVRVGKNDSFLIGQALDIGASGVVVPMVNTVDDARKVVEAAKFPPAGRRSFGSRRLVGIYGYEYADAANERTVVLVQLESERAIKNADVIAAVDGIDGLIFSPDDYVREKGLNVIIPRPPELGLAEKRAIAKAAASHKKIAGCFCDNPAALKTSLEIGYRLIVVAEEDTIIIEGCRAARKWVKTTARQVLQE